MGSALLHHAFYHRDIHKDGLGVDGQSLTCAQQPYERVEMHVAQRFARYEKEPCPGRDLRSRVLRLALNSLQRPVQTKLQGMRSQASARQHSSQQEQQAAEPKKIPRVVEEHQVGHRKLLRNQQIAKAKQDEGHPHQQAKARLFAQKRQ